jgi:hypothetical protein
VETPGQSGGPIPRRCCVASEPEQWRSTIPISDFAGRRSTTLRRNSIRRFLNCEKASLNGSTPTPTERRVSRQRSSGCLSHGWFCRVGSWEYSPSTRRVHQPSSNWHPFPVHCVNSRRRSELRNSLGRSSGSRNAPHLNAARSGFVHVIGLCRPADANLPAILRFISRADLAALRYFNRCIPFCRGRIAPVECQPRSVAVVTRH